MWLRLAVSGIAFSLQKGAYDWAVQERDHVFRALVVTLDNSEARMLCCTRKYHNVTW